MLYGVCRKGYSAVIYSNTMNHSAAYYGTVQSLLGITILLIIRKGDAQQVCSCLRHC